MEPSFKRIDRVRTLLIEDDESDVYLVREILAKSRNSELPAIELMVASTLGDGLRQLERNCPDIVLLDLMLPDSRGMESLRQVAAKAGRTPIVVLSGISDEKLSLEAAEYGAQDFLVKGKVEAMWLSRILRYAVARRPPGSYAGADGAPVPKSGGKTGEKSAN
jgi:DNA-binding response OmpR family regulator